MDIDKASEDQEVDLSVQDDDSPAPPPQLSEDDITEEPLEPEAVPDGEEESDDTPEGGDDE